MARRHSRKIPITELPGAIEKILKEYGDDATKEMAEVTRKVVNKGTQALRSTSSVTVTSRYGRGWGYTIEKSRLRTTGIIWHKQTPGLPHLLENGHAKTNGGRVPGRPHVAPVREIVERDFVDEIRRSFET